MKSLKMLFVAAALLLVTAGVFAGKAKFSNELYVYNGSSFVNVASSVTFNSAAWSTSGSVQATTIDNTSTSYPLYYGQSLSDKIFVIEAF
jgi:hypothetical protein